MAGTTGKEAARLIHVGTVSKPHGIRGEVKIYSLSGQPQNFRDYTRLVLIDAAGKRADHAVTAFRAQGKFAVVGLAGVADRSRAEELDGCQVWVAASALAPLAEDEFYWHDVMGAEVVDREGKVLGTLTGLMAAGGADLMVVRQGDDEIFIPSRPEFIVEIGAARIIVDLPPGLVDINRE